MHPFHRRILKEYKGLQAGVPGAVLVLTTDDLEVFEFDLHPDNPIYTEPSRLVVRITDSYPVEPPNVKFTAQDYAIPLHPHIYSNGHICLNLLGTDWTPACSIESVVVSLLLMLNSNTRAERPPDDAQYVARAPRDARAGGFVYHDDDV